MRLGVMLFLRSAQIGVAPPLARIAEFSALIEEKGFTGLWFADSVGRGYATLDPLCVLCALAGTPGHIELGTAILQVPLRQPRELAYRIQTVNALTAGRLRLGVGAGSTRTDFEALDADYDTRLMTLPRSIATMQAMWRNEFGWTACADALAWHRRWASHLSRGMAQSKMDHVCRTAMRWLDRLRPLHQLVGS